MSLYHCTISRDGNDRQSIVHWDDNDAGRDIVAPCTMPATELDEARLAGVVGSMGFRIASEHSDNIGRGWAIVSPNNRDRPFYDPIDRDWRAYLSDDRKREIRDSYPDAVVPGCHVGHR